MVAQASLANLKAPWEPGKAISGPRRKGDVLKAVRMARKQSVEAIAFLTKIMRDEAAELELRVRAAQTILQHGMPKGVSAIGLANDLDREDGGIGVLRIEFVTPELEAKTINAKQSTSNGASNGQGPSAPVFDVTFVDAEDEPQP